jgi:hypothetical protein
VRNTGNEIEEKWEINEIERRIGRKLTGIEGSEHLVFFGASEIARGRKFLERRQRNEMVSCVYEVIVPSLDPTVCSPKAVKDLSYPCFGKWNRRFFNKKRRFSLFTCLFIYLLVFFYYFILFSLLFLLFVGTWREKYFLKDVLCSDPSEGTERIRARG